MKKQGSTYHSLPEKPSNPFRVPENYFENLGSNIMDRIQAEEAQKKTIPVRKISFRPYLSLAASISGLALVIYIVLQSISGNLYQETESYDVALLESSGIIQDESTLIESIFDSEEDTYSAWEEDAITYLASNEMDVLFILESN